MKGCLKHLQLSATGPSPLSSPRKTVAFETNCLEQIFQADQWDRTPTEPARNLSYQDLLELKEIQRSLPRANQPADLLAGRSGSHYLSNVPIGLLPLLPETTPTTPQPQSPPTPSYSRYKPTAMSPTWTSFSPTSPDGPVPSSPPLGGVDAMLHPSNLSHLPPARREEPKQRPRFAFLPLLDNNPTAPPTDPSRSRSPSPELSSDTDPPTPALTNASLTSSPLSRASSCSPEPPFFQLPPPRKRPGYNDPYTPVFGDEQPENDSFYPAITSALGNVQISTPRSPFGPPKSTVCKSNLGPRFVPPPPPSARTVAKPAKKRNVIYVNGMEIDLDDDEEDECTTPPANRSPPQPTAPSIPIRNSFTTPSSPTLRWQSPPGQSPISSTNPDSPFSGLHAPVRFKRQPPSTKGDCSSPMSTSPPVSTSPRRGSVCSTKMKGAHVSPRSSPVLMPRA